MADLASGIEATEDLISIDQFLVSIEKRAYKMAMIAVRDHHEALDIVQEAMIKLVTNYSQRPVAELKPLFYRILHNKVTDWHRHQKLKNMLFFWQSSEAEESAEPMLEVASAQVNSLVTPSDHIQHEQLKVKVAKALSCLSSQQQQCFLLRSWEGFSVTQTASILGCSEGSVKTHHFRAIAKMKEVLGVEDENV